MPTTKQGGSQVSDRRDIVISVYEILDEAAPRAYCVDDFFRNAGPGGPAEHGLLEAFKRAVLWQMSRTRSKAQVERALETLVARDEVEKRVLLYDGKPVPYYRMRSPAERRL